PHWLGFLDTRTGWGMTGRVHRVTRGWPIPADPIHPFDQRRYRTQVAIGTAMRVRPPYRWRYGAAGRPAAGRARSVLGGEVTDHSADLLDRDGALAQQPRHRGGEVDDRRRDVVRARSAVEVDRDRIAELLLGLLDRGRGRLARAVRARHRHGAGLPEQVERDLVHGHADRHRALGVAEIPGQRRVGAEDQRERAGPEGVDE